MRWGGLGWRTGEDGGLGWRTGEDGGGLGWRTGEDGGGLDGERVRMGGLDGERVRMEGGWDGEKVRMGEAGMENGWGWGAGEWVRQEDAYTLKGVHYPMNKWLSKQIINNCWKILKMKMYSSPVALLHFTQPENLPIAKNFSRPYFKLILVLGNV